MDDRLPFIIVICSFGWSWTRWQTLWERDCVSFYVFFKVKVRQNFFNSLNCTRKDEIDILWFILSYPMPKEPYQKEFFNFLFNCPKAEFTILLVFASAFSSIYFTPLIAGWPPILITHVTHETCVTISFCSAKKCKHVFFISLSCKANQSLIL
jgi:hypothetical protein